MICFLLNLINPIYLNGMYLISSERNDRMIVMSGLV